MSDEFAAARRAMIVSQVQPNKVTDERILDVLGRMPRERFVPKARQSVAYVDEDLEIAPGRILMEPMVFARLLQEAGVTDDDLVLALGVGTGYPAAVLGALAGAVVAIESDAGLAEKATERLSELEVSNATVVVAPLAEGYAADAPYNVIFINGSVETLPDALFDQLADGGRLVTVEGAHAGAAVVYLRHGDQIDRRVLFDASVPVLPEFRREPAFTF
ncbi:protein-L-isoaspartate O-methyltransferase family protein [Oceanibacterium hippocampi]|uniref:Protein-L-isoaspartate O-methyltransferase n=1 Tax=Oceanibacterium hippocampi TaxID=745714 RepID=A0A1Y5TZK3_9PROT|nr:protein-L-isoaspartate O-methyltransferase [Oceanibacterium hippocampi]SLN77257.1 Protein-L-isoaspartate O-methyltransferase [Oceanibacterium hippocampi]